MSFAQDMHQPATNFLDCAWQSNGISGMCVMISLIIDNIGYVTAVFRRYFLASFDIEFEMMHCQVSRRHPDKLK